MISVKYNTGYGYATGGLYYGDSLSTPLVEDIFNSSREPNYLYCDGDGIDLTNENAKFYKSGDYTGYISRPSDADSVVDSLLGGFVEFTGNFSQVSVIGITFKFYGDCCRKMRLRYFDGDTIITTHYIGDEYAYKITNDTFFYIPVLSDTNCTKIQIQFLKSKVPHQTVKLLSVAFGEAEIIGIPQIKYTSLSEKINILSDDLPVSEFDFTAVYDKEFLIDHKISVYSNNMYYGTFWITKSAKAGVKKGWVFNETTNENEYIVVSYIYDVTAINAIGKIDVGLFDKWRSEAVSNVYCTFSDLLSDIKTNTGVRTQSAETTYQNMALLGFVPQNSYRYILCAFGWGLGYMIDANRNDKISLLPMIHGDIKTIPESRIIGEAKYTSKPTITSALYSYVEDIGQGDIGGQITLKSTGNKRINVKFNNPPQLAYVDGASKPTAWSATAYWYSYKSNADFIITQTGRIPRTEIISINNELAQNVSNNVVEYNQFDVVGLSPYSFTSDLIPEITGTKVYRTDDIQRYIKGTGTVTARIVLNDEKCGDRVSIATAFDGNKQGIITKMDVSFGYQDVADIEITLCDIQEWQV